MYKNIIYPIDINDKNSWAPLFPGVTDMVKACNAKLTLAHVIQDYGVGLIEQYFPKGWVEDLIKKSEIELEKIKKEYIPEGIVAECLVGRGNIYRAIIDMAERIGADLIVMSAHRPELRDYLLGPNVAKVVRHAKVSVLVLRDEVEE